MAKQNAGPDLAAVLRDKVKPPVALVLGAPREVAELVALLGIPGVTCYQMDLYQADRLREELAGRGLTAEVVTAPDLWDLPGDFATVVYPTTKTGERELKIDMTDQAFHTLRPRGTLVVLSPWDSDTFFPPLLKKIYGRLHATHVPAGTVFWCHREGDRPRRRHEVTFQARVGSSPSLRFLSRPGTFSYGHFDDGARALLEVAAIRPGDSLLDLGCGVGTNGVFAAQRAGPLASITFVDSNVRAVALTGHNARANGVVSFQALATPNMEGLTPESFDVILANPPYYAQAAIAQRFTEASRHLLRPGGRFYLVTKQESQVCPFVEEAFGLVEAAARRGYCVLGACAPTAGGEILSPFQ